MTWITDSSGTKWGEPIRRKRRKSPRALRFKALAVGDQSMLKPRQHSIWGQTIYYLVTDLWFDPVRGYDDAVKGLMVGFQQIGLDGIPWNSKSSTPIRGLASQQYAYADINYIEMCFTRSRAMQDGAVVVGIGQAKKIRARPKIPGGRL